MLQTINNLTLFKEKKREERRKGVRKRMHLDGEKEHHAPEWHSKFRCTVYKCDTGKSCSSGWAELLSYQLCACMWMGEDYFLCGLSAVAETSLYMVSYYQNLNLLLIYLNNLKLKLTFKKNKQKTL